MPHHGNRFMPAEPEGQKLWMRNWPTDQTLANELKAVDGHIASSIAAAIQWYHQ
jgi:hypothetical protein